MKDSVRWLTICLVVCCSSLLTRVGDRDTVLAGDGLDGKVIAMPQEEDTTNRLFPVLSRSCGLNSLYVMLRLQGMPISHAEITDAVAVGPAGSNMLELAEGAKRLGVDLQVYRGTLEDLEQWDMKGVIVLIHQEGADKLLESVGTNTIQIGHYVTLVGYDAKQNRILGIDGTYGNTRWFSKKRFREMWTGYYLAPRAKPWSVRLTRYVWMLLPIGIFAAWVFSDDDKRFPLNLFSRTRSWWQRKHAERDPETC